MYHGATIASVMHHGGHQRGTVARGIDSSLACTVECATTCSTVHGMHHGTSVGGDWMYPDEFHGTYYRASRRIRRVECYTCIMARATDSTMVCKRMHHRSRFGKPHAVYQTCHGSRHGCKPIARCKPWSRVCHGGTSPHDSAGHGGIMDAPWPVPGRAPWTHATVWRRYALFNFMGLFA